MTGAARTTTGSSGCGALCLAASNAAARQERDERATRRRAHHAATGALQWRSMNCSCAGMAATQLAMTLRTLSPSFARFGIGQAFDQRMLGRGHDALTQHHLHPARLREHLVAVADRTGRCRGTSGCCPRGSAGSACCRSTSRTSCRAARWRSSAGSGNRGCCSISNAACGVVAILQHRVHVPVGQHVDEARDAGLDEIDAGRFERLEKAAGEADGDAVARSRSCAGGRS